MKQEEYQILLLKKKIIHLIAQMNLDVCVALAALEGIKMHCCLFHNVPSEIFRLQSNDLAKAYEEMRKEYGMD